MINTQRLADLIAYSIIDEWALNHPEMHEFEYEWFGKSQVQQLSEYQDVSAIVEQIVNSDLDDLGIEYIGYND
jgi:hypothetical protein